MGSGLKAKPPQHVQGLGGVGFRTPGASRTLNLKTHPTWRFMGIFISGVMSRVTVIITHISGLTLLGGSWVFFIQWSYKSPK